MTVEEHHSAEELERLFREEKSARMPSKFGLSGRRGWAAPNRRSRRKSAWLAVPFSSACGVTTLQGWRVSRGLSGLQDRVGRGLKPLLSPTEETLFRQRIEAEPQRNEEICSWRGVDCQRFLETQFGQQKSLSAVSWLLHRLGYEWLLPRPQHKKSAPKLRPLSKTSSRTDCRDRSPASGQEDRRLLSRRMPLRTTRDADSPSNKRSIFGFPASGTGRNLSSRLRLAV